MVDFAGWEMPQQYTSVREEQQAVRTKAGIFDVSHMGRFEVRGGSAGEFLQSVVTNDLSSLEPDRARYSLMCHPNGGIVDDVVVYRHDETWMVVVNAANRDKDSNWLRDHAPAGVEIADRSEELSLIALQGPGARDLLPFSEPPSHEIPYFGIASAEVAGVPCTISRTGYTGEDGFELFSAADRAVDLWQALIEAGARPCGLAARDVCRLEAGLRLYGTDMDDQTNPYEAGLGWTVKLGKGSFIGRDALRRAREAGPSRMLAGLSCAGRTIPRHGAAVRRGGRDIGAVTSGTYSFWLGRGIGMALLETGTAPVGEHVAIDVRGDDAPAEVAALPFYRGSVGLAARIHG